MLPMLARLLLSILVFLSGLFRVPPVPPVPPFVARPAAAGVFKARLSDGPAEILAEHVAACLASRAVARLGRVDRALKKVADATFKLWPVALQP